jgi:hypothetical protein
MKSRQKDKIQKYTEQRYIYYHVELLRLKVLHLLALDWMNSLPHKQPTFIDRGDQDDSASNRTRSIMEGRNTARRTVQWHSTFSKKRGRIEHACMMTSFGVTDCWSTVQVSHKTNAVASRREGNDDGREPIFSSSGSSRMYYYL